MSHVCRLIIQRHGGVAPVVAGARSVDVFTGGPHTLLTWLETCLGLPTPPVASSERIVAYGRAVASTPGKSFVESFAADAWATTTELLVRRDALRLAGWDGQDRDAAPTLLRDLAAIEQIAAGLAPAIAERLDAILHALRAGQTLPEHAVTLDEPVEHWPAAWRPVLDMLHTHVEVAAPAARTGALVDVQRAVLHAEEVVPLAPDDSVRWMTARSGLAACEAVAVMLQESGPDDAVNTVVSCEDDDTALLLDACLARRGLPTMGASRRRGSEPALAVLPLALELCWDPVDPAVLLQFLELPLQPIPRRAARQLARALAEHPGLGSDTWNAARAEIEDPEHDADGAVRTRLATWFDHARVARGESIPVALVAERCERVAQWATAQAFGFASDDRHDALAETLRAVAAQATALRALAAAQGERVSEAQLGRLLDTVRVNADTSPAYPAAAGAPSLVRRLVDVPPRAQRLIWLGLSTKDTPLSRWTGGEIEALRACGIDVDDGARDLATLRHAERRGLARISRHVLAVSLPTDEESRPHPVWVHVQALFAPGTRPIQLERAIAEGEVLQPWRLVTTMTDVERPHAARAEWPLEAGLLEEVRRSSATELEERLSCPIRWVFKRQAHLWPRGNAAMPEGGRLRGTFCHAVLERVFQQERPVPTVAEALAEVAATFDERLPLDAAPLAQPSRARERASLRNELLRSTEALVTLLHEGGYRVKAMEADVDATFDGRPFTGSIDCLLEHEDGSEAILDFKYASVPKHREMLAEGRATQLAAYAYARGAMRQQDDVVHGVGYLMLHRAAIMTPEGAPLRGVQRADIIAGAPAVRETWDAFVRALASSDAWLRDGGPVPAPPLQHTNAWTEGARWMLDGKAEEDMPCRYCDHARLCGRQEVR